jgi:DNA-binding transcriptional regulator YiaG
VELECAFGLSSDDTTRALDVNVRTVERWRKGDVTPYTYNQEETAFLEKALEIYNRRHSEAGDA